MWRALYSLSMVSRYVVLCSSVIAIYFIDEILLLIEHPLTLSITLGVESLVFVNSIAPLGLLSLVSAHYVIMEQAWLWLFMGYFTGLLANVASYGLGRCLANSKFNTSPNKTSFFLTFWHPQLASLAAFNEGLRREAMLPYFGRSTCFSTLWFSVVCVVIAQVPPNTGSSKLVLIAFLSIIVWTAYDVLKIVLRKPS